MEDKVEKDVTQTVWDRLLRKVTKVEGLTQTVLEQIVRLEDELVGLPTPREGGTCGEGDKTTPDFVSVMRGSLDDAENNLDEILTSLNRIKEG